MNMERSLLTTLLCLSMSLPSFACSVDGKEGILPENDMWISADQKSPSGLNQTEFDDVISQINTIYAPEIARMGRKLVVQKLWTDGTVNAQAMQSGTNWVLRLFGGMARHPLMSRDGYALVVCHELGHHLGGAPKKTNGWASNEGQSDYFATLKCLRRVFLNDNSMALLRGVQASTTLINACKTAWPAPADYAICVRSGLAGLSVAKVFQAMRNAPTAPNFNTPVKQSVAVTDDGHPAYQCRLDTYFQGSICHVDETVALSNTNDRQGVCHPANGDKVGGRPFCWYRPR